MRAQRQKSAPVNPAHSPLFEPVLWCGAGFAVLDELKLPETIEYIQVSEVAQALDAVREMRTRAFGQVLTFLYSAALTAQNHPAEQPESLARRLADMTEQFCSARPTFDFRGLGSYLQQWCKEAAPLEGAGTLLARRAREFARQIVQGREARARRAAELLPNPARVLTHCNVSGELVAVAHYCRALGKELRVIATETRPYLQGARLTAWELARASVPVEVIPDGAVAQVMADGETNAVIVGADRTARNGDIINKVGTYTIARLALNYGIPFYALVQDPRSLERGADVPIEERPARELLVFAEQPLVPGPQEHLEARYPAFDVTPADLITRLVGFDAVHTPASFREKYPGTADSTLGRDNSTGAYLLLYGIPSESQYRFLLSALQTEQARSILVPEMRPQLWGARSVAPALLARRAPTTLIADNMMGALFARGEIRKLYLFYAALDERGVTGICGSLSAVQLARLHGVGIELLADSGQEPPALDHDVSTFLGKKLLSPGVTVRALHPERVPWQLFKG